MAPLQQTDHQRSLEPLLEVSADQPEILARFCHREAGLHALRRRAEELDHLSRAQHLFAAPNDQAQVARASRVDPAATS